MEVVTMDLKNCNPSKDLDSDILEWRNKIRTDDPYKLGQSLDDDDSGGDKDDKLIILYELPFNC